MGTLDLDPGRPWQHGYGERCNGTGRDEWVTRHVFHSVAEAGAVRAGDRRQDNEARPHSRWGDRTPTECKREWLQRQS
jgi:transposase InsO family protein